MASSYQMLSWDAGEARVTKCATTSTAKATTIRLEIEVTDRHRLGTLMSDIRELMEQPAPARRPRG